MSSFSDFGGWLRLLLVALCVAPVAACDYEAPPEVELVFPPEGTFIEGDPLRLAFDTAVEPDTLVVRIWPDLRDVENELEDVEPHLERCTVAMSPCGTTTLEVDEDGLGATVTLDPEDLGKPDIPLLLEVLPGLVAVDTGADTGRSLFFDFQFKPFEVQEDPVPFDEGQYLFVSIVEQPVPTVITLITDIRTTPDGRVWLVGAEGDEIGDAPQNTNNPEELMVDTSEQGFVVFVEGTIRENDRGERFLETTPFILRIFLGPVTIEVFGTRFTGKVITNEETGMDRIQGTLSFDGITLFTGPENSFTYAAGTTTFIADFIPPEILPEGSPAMCEGDPCGVVTEQCLIPDDFDATEYCDESGGETEGSGALTEGSGGS